MPGLLFKIIGGFILLASWVSREMWARRQEQRFSAYRRELDGKARAEDAYLVVLTQRRMFDSIVYMQTVALGFPDSELGKPTSPQQTKYLDWANKILHELDKSRKSYALDRLSHLWAIVKGTQAHTDEKATWNQMTEDEIMKLGDEFVPQIDLAEKRLNRNNRLADRIVAILYIIGAVLILATG